MVIAFPTARAICQLRQSLIFHPGMLNAPSIDSLVREQDALGDFIRTIFLISSLSDLGPLGTGQ